MTTYVFLIVSGEIKSPQKRSLWLEWCHAVRKAKEIYASRERATMLRYTYTADIVRSAETRVAFSFFIAEYILPVKTLRF